jgi:hypothetical protein
MYVVLVMSLSRGEKHAVFSVSLSEWLGRKHYLWFFIRFLFMISTSCLLRYFLERETQLPCGSEVRVAASQVETELTL